MKRNKTFQLVLLGLLALVCLFALPSTVLADAITNPTFDDIADTVGTGFNIGLGVAVAAGIALAAWALFKRAVRR